MEAVIVHLERNAIRWLPAGLVVAANARLHRWKGEHELHELPRLVTPGTLALDIGAHFGTYSHALSRIVGKRGKVIAVEPVAEDARLLRTASRQLRLPLDVRELAISDSSGTAILNIPGRHGRAKTALSSLHTHEGETEARTVQTQTVDDLTSGETLPISFIKIDVEGHEMAVIRGAERTLREHHPNLLIEIEGRFRSDGVDPVVQHLVERGYRCEFIDGNGVRQDYESFDPAIHQDQSLDPLDPRYIANFIFIPSASGHSGTGSQ